MAPPSSPEISPVAALMIMQVVTFVCLFISVVIIATNNLDGGKINKFNVFYVICYMLAVGVIGSAYTLFQIAFTIYFVCTGNRLGGNCLAFLDFYAHKALSYLLATGAAAFFGLSVDLRRLIELETDVKDFLNEANAAASLLFAGFIFSAVSSIFSSFSLPK